jgi:arsenate reductase
MIKIYHNPRCSKSREALVIAEAFSARKKLAIEIVDYLKTPLSLEQLRALQRQLKTPLRDMVRENEPEYRDLGLADADDGMMLQALAAHPKLLQRPVVVYEGRAVIGRPPERVHELLK